MARVRPSSHSSQTIPKARVFIPPDRYNYEIKIQVVTQSNGTITLNDYNSVNYVQNITITGRSLMRGFKDAVVKLINPLGLFNNLITAGDTITIIAEYTDGTPTRVQFAGKIMYPQKTLDKGDGFTMTLHCWQIPQVIQRRITETADGTVSYDFVKTIVDNWFSSVLTYTNLSSSMTTVLTRQYVQKFGGSVLNEIFDKCGYTGYVDSDGDINSWSITDPTLNATEFLAFGINCEEVPGYGDDLRKTKNAVVVTGDRVEGQGELFYIWGKKDSDDVDSTWQRDAVYNDNTLNSQTAVETDTELAYDSLTRTDDTGRLVSESYGLETLEAGQSMRCYVPHCGLDGEYVVNEFTHSITPTAGSWITTVQLEKYSMNMIDVLKVRDDSTKGNSLASNNPNGMIGGFVLTFNGEEGISHSNTEIINNTLLLQSGYGTGTATSALKDVDDDIEAIEIRLRGEDLGASNVDVTVDNEEKWDENTGINTNNEFEVTSTSVNKKRLKFRIDLATDSDNSTPKVWSAECFFRYAR